MERLESSVERASPGILTSEELAVARRRVEGLVSLADPALVPTHRDWQPRSWLVEGPEVYAIDFEHSRPGPWLEDIQRLWWAEWWERPDLRETFLSGYGRQMSATDPTGLLAISAIAAVSTVVWAHEHDDLAFAVHGHEILARLALS